METYLHEALAYLLLPSMGRKSGEAMVAEDLEAGTPEMSTCQNHSFNPLYLPRAACRQPVGPGVKKERCVPTCARAIF